VSKSKFKFARFSMAIVAIVAVIVDAGAGFKF
jgi:hypothetical protein